MFPILNRLLLIKFNIPRSDLLNRCSIYKTTKFYSTTTMNQQDRKCLVAVCQHTCKANKNDNFKEFENQIENAKKAGCKLVFLPECFDFIGESKQQTYELMESIDGQLITKYRQLAAKLNVWLFLGGMHERTSNNPNDKPSNGHIAINDKGEIVRVYHKLHLFDLDIPCTRLLESEYTKSGDRVEPLVQTPAGSVGLGICYDVRFPEFACSMAKAGASILTYPSSFTIKTGLAHWETLLRARAIENQCYVIAAAQNGVHNAKRSSYGHSMIIDPWGHIIAQVGDKSGYAIGEIDFDYLDNVRKRLPVWTDRRSECYGYIIPPSEDQFTIDKQTNGFKFGHVNIKSSQVFLKTNYSFSFVNHRPVLPGHVLVSCLREVKKFTDLTADEVSDLFNTVQKVQKVIEKEHNANSSTICIQDGIDAGQSIQHVHVHILPRKADDFGGKVDKIYEELRTHDKKSGPIASDEVMKKQADRLRELMFEK